jgi:pimeloyl-ACP methyl ester carboxylesterase
MTGPVRTRENEDVEMPLRLSALVLAFVLTALPCSAEIPGKQSDWHGFVRHDFSHDGRKCILVSPEKPAEGKPWVWRARFFGHEPQADVALLKLGYHVAYCDVSNLFGSPTAVKHWDSFYELATKDLGLAKKPALEGMSRGGLIIYNWAIANPDKVACLYGDAPVCDFKSWPGGKGKGKGGGGAWASCLKAYGFTEEQALAFRGNPIDNLKPLAAAKVPILHVVGAADVVVPVAENTALIEARYKELGGDLQVISKPGIGHHPHALKDPKPIVDFILKHTLNAKKKAAGKEAAARSI